MIFSSGALAPHLPEDLPAAGIWLGDTSSCRVCRLPPVLTHARRWAKLRGNAQRGSGLCPASRRVYGVVRRQDSFTRRDRGSAAGAADAGLFRWAGEAMVWFVASSWPGSWPCRSCFGAVSGDHGPSPRGQRITVRSDGKRSHPVPWPDGSWSGLAEQADLDPDLRVAGPGPDSGEGGSCPCSVGGGSWFRRL